MSKYKCNDCGTDFFASRYNLVCPACGSSNIITDNEESTGGGFISKLKKFILKYRWYFISVIILIIISIFRDPDPDTTPIFTFDGKLSENKFITTFQDCEDNPSIARALTIFNYDNEGNKYKLIMKENGLYFPILKGKLEILKPKDFSFCKNHFKNLYKLKDDFKTNDYDESYHIQIPDNNRQVKSLGCNGTEFIIYPRYQNKNFQFSIDNKNWSTKQKFSKEEIFGNDQENKTIFVRNKRYILEVTELTVFFKNIKSNDFDFQSVFKKIKRILDKDNLTPFDKLDLVDLDEVILKNGGKITPSITEIMQSHPLECDLIFDDCSVELPDCR